MQELDTIPGVAPGHKPPVVREVHILWLTAGLSCDGDSVSTTAATLPSIEDVILGAVPNLPKVHLHNPVLAFEVGEEFMQFFHKAAQGQLDPFVLVIEGSIPNEKIKPEGYWAAMGTDPHTGQPVTTCEWIDRLAPKAFAVVCAGTCATYGGIHAMAGNPTGAMGVADYLGWDFRSKGKLPIVNVPGCPVQPDNMMETLLYLLRHAAGEAPPIPMDDQLRPTWLFGKTVHEGCDRAGYYEQADFGHEYGTPKCMVKIGCWGPVVNCNVPKRGWMDGIGGCPDGGVPLPQSGTFMLHGRPVDVLPDEKALVDFRARVYDPEKGRWLQRDPLGYGDGPNLYESFRGNSTRFTDPEGKSSMDDLFEFFRDYLGPAALWRQAEDSAAGVAPSSPAEQVITTVAQAEPYVRPAMQAAGALGGLSQIGAGVVITAGSEGFGSPIGLILVGRGTDVTLTNAANLLQGIELPTGQWLLVNWAAGPSVASLSELAVDLGTLPAGVQAVPFRGPAPVFSSMATFEGFEAIPVLTQAAQSASLLDRAAARTQRVLSSIVGEDEGYLLGMGVSPGQLGRARGGALPVRLGQMGVLETEMELGAAGFTVLGREVTMETAAARTRLDLLVQAPAGGGILPGTSRELGPMQQFFIEVKTGTGRLSENQRLAFPKIREVGGIPRGFRAHQAELNVGELNGPYEVIILRRP